MSQTATSSTLSVASGAINLCVALVDASNAGTFAHQLVELGQWIGRQGLSRQELQSCLLKAENLVMPNSNAQRFFTKIIEDDANGPAKRLNVPLWLRPSRALGRVIAADPALCWIQSTVACLFQFHNESFVSDALCSIMLSTRFPRHGEFVDYDLKYHPARVPLKSVLDKIVSSVWLNVVNTGHHTLGLPEELNKVCLKGHSLDDIKLGYVISTLLENRAKVVVKSRNLLKNLTLWLMLHFKGRLRVVVAGKVLHQTVLGGDRREVELRVELFCDDQKPCVDSQLDKSPFEILEDVSGELRTLRSGLSSLHEDLGSRPRVRQKLYSSAQGEVRPYDSSTRILFRSTAQEMMRWLLQIGLARPQNFSNFGFSAVLDNRGFKERFTVGDLLRRRPNILDMEWGNRPPSKLVFAEPVMSDGADDHDSQDLSDISDMDIDTSDISGEGFKTRQHPWDICDVLPFFPILQDLIRPLRAGCTCEPCRNDKPPTKEGCPRNRVLTDTLLLVAQGVADSFGAADMSASAQSNHTLRAIGTLLLELVTENKVIWDTWFSVAACVFLGSPFRRTMMDIDSAGTTIAALQYGDLAVAAPWIDISKSLTVRGCFGFLAERGQLGTAKVAEDGSLRHFQGVEGNFAVVQTEHTEDVSSYSAKYQKKEWPTGKDRLVTQDSDPLKCDFMLVTATEEVYRFYTFVQSKSHRRIIDPSDAMIRLARHIDLYECRHKRKAQKGSFPPDVRAKLYCFDEVLGRWAGDIQFFGRNKTGPPMLEEDSVENEEAGSSADADGHAVMHLTSFLDTHAKVNVAMALTVDNLLVANDKSSCPTCVFAQAKAQAAPPDMPRPPADRYIINMLKNPNGDMDEDNSLPWERSTDDTRLTIESSKGRDP